MHPFHWIYINREFLAALNGIAISILTIVLLIVNYFSIRANYKVAQLMEADLEYRTLSFPSLSAGVGYYGMPPDSVIQARVEFSTTHAPLLLHSVYVYFQAEGPHLPPPEKRSDCIEFTFGGFRPVAAGEEIVLIDRLKEEHRRKYVSAEVFYTDISKKRRYLSRFNEKGEIHTNLMDKWDYADLRRRTLRRLGLDKPQEPHP